MRTIPYLLYLLLIAFYVVILRDLVSIWGVSINLPAFIAIAVALYKSELTALWFGFVAGVVLAAGTPTAMGWHALSLSIIAVMIYHARARLNLESLKAKFLLMFGGVLLHNILVVVIGQADGFGYLVWTAALPGAAYTAVAGGLFFAFKERRITYRKLRAIF